MSFTKPLYILCLYSKYVYIHTHTHIYIYMCTGAIYLWILPYLHLDVIPLDVTACAKSPFPLTCLVKTPIEVGKGCGSYPLDGSWCSERWRKSYGFIWRGTPWCFRLFDRVNNNPSDRVTPFSNLVGFSSAASVTSSQYSIYICTYVKKQIHIYIDI